MLARYTNHDDESERGQIIVLFAMVLVLILVFTALVVDVGLLRNDRQRLVNALDAGVLAGAAMLPVDGAATGWEAILDAIEDEIAATFPGLVRDVDYTISFRCLIGADPATGAPLIARDIPSICKPYGALGTTSPQPHHFIGAGTTRSSDCDPVLNDVCNVVLVEGAVNTQYNFGPAVGINEGSTGSVVSSACNGPCGQPVAVPLDVVMIMDRTYSMVTPSPNLIPALRNAGRAVLEAYSPEFQHVALGLLGPSSLSSTCAGSPGGVRGFVIQEPVQTQTAAPPSYQSRMLVNPTNSNISSLSIERPASTGGSDLLVATIAYRLNSGSSNVSGVSITAPSGWTQIQRTNQGSGAASIALVSYYRVGGGGTTTISTGPSVQGYTFNFGTAGRASGAIMRFTNVDTSAPILGSTSNSGDNGSSNGNATANGINGLPANAQVIAAYARSATFDIAQPNNWQERFNTTGSAGPSVSANTRATTSNANVNAGGGNQEWAAQQFALKTNLQDVWTPDEYGTVYGANYSAANAPQWIPVQLTGVPGEAGSPIINEAYNNSATDPINRTLNPSSQIVKAIDCMEPAMTGYPGTNLKTPIEMATAYLNQYGRPGVKKGIILETDGVPQYATTGDASNYTCAATEAAATVAKNAGIEIYTIGFFRPSGSSVTIPNCISDSGYGNAARLLARVGSNTNSSLNDCTARENSDDDNFYCASSGADLRTIFLHVATQLAEIKPRLVHIYPVPFVSAVAPNVGSPGGGTAVTISGRYFTGATSVSFGGANVTPTVINDTTIVVMSPPGVAGRTVDVHVRTPGGVSPTTVADRFTYSP